MNLHNSLTVLRFSVIHMLVLMINVNIILFCMQYISVTIYLMYFSITKINAFSLM